MTDWFYFKGLLYRGAPIVQVKDEYRKDFKFNTYLVFEGYDEKNKICHFHYLHNVWEKYVIPVDKLDIVILNVTPDCNYGKKQSPIKVEEKYIENIVSAWIWYLLAMFLAVFLKDLSDVILAWTTASFIFFRWRHIKMNGG